MSLWLVLAGVFGLVDGLLFVVIDGLLVFLMWLSCGRDLSILVLWGGRYSLVSGTMWVLWFLVCCGFTDLFVVFRLF